MAVLCSQTRSQFWSLFIDEEDVVILRGWLDPGFRDVAATTEMLRPFDAGQMRRHPVSTRVNNVAIDDLECSEPLQSLSTAQTRLF